MQNSKIVVVRNQDIYGAVDALRGMGEIDLKMTLMHSVALTARNVNAEIETLDEVQRKLSDKYVLRDGDGNKVPSKSEDVQGFKIDPEMLDDFLTAQREFMQETMKLTVFPLKSTDFGENAKLKANIAVGMMGIEAYEIVEDESKKEKEKEE